MENRSYENDNIEKKYLNIMRKNQFLKVKNSLLELEKYLIDLKDIELKYREIKIKREIEELFFKPIFVSIEDMDRFEEEGKKKKSIRNSWCDWLINFLPKSINKV